MTRESDFRPILAELFERSYRFNNGKTSLGLYQLVSSALLVLL